MALLPYMFRAMGLALLALALMPGATIAPEPPPCAHDSCPSDAVEHAGLLQHAVQLVETPVPRTGSGPGRSLGMHYMMLLAPYVGQTMDMMNNFVENVLELDTCFNEILVTLDHGTRMPGQDWNARRKIPEAGLKLLNRSSSTAWFYCGVKERTKHLVKKLEHKCGHKVSGLVHVLDVSLPHVRDAGHRIFGTRELPLRMFKNTFAYLYGPAVMKSDYIVHVDDDILINRKSPGAFVQQALQVLDHTTAASVNMPCCNCREIEEDFTLLTGSEPQLDGFEVGQLTFKDPHPENAFPVPGVDVQSLCTTLQNFITMQVYVLHAERFRRMFPMKADGVASPAMLHIECLLTAAAAATTPPTLFAWIGGGSSQCRKLRLHQKAKVNVDPAPSSALGRCMGSPWKDAANP